jgi:hypothetical protein
MEKEFAPYEQALALKELGFEYISTIFAYDDAKELYTRSGIPHDFNIRGLLSAPTFSQAFRWFREKHNLRGFIGFRPNVKQFDYHIYDMSLSGKEYVKQRTTEEYNKDPKVGTYEEAELECLKKLIEIVKEKK